MIALPPPARFAWMAMALEAAAPAGTGNAPHGYGLRIPVTAGTGSIVQRLALPPAMLAAARTWNLADVRIFDGRGRAMPMARIPVAPNTRRDGLAAMPILGTADALKVSGVSLRIDDAGRARVAQIDGTVATEAERPVLLGTLLDARAITGVAHSLTLDADIPVAQPVTFMVAASRDLSTWRPLGEKTVYRAKAETTPDRTIPLGLAGLKDDYLKLTWRLGSRPLTPVIVRQATLVSQPTASTTIRWVDATLPPAKDTHRIDIAVPFATPVAALRVLPTGGDVLLPVRILGRDDAEQPWTLLGTGIAAHVANAIPLTGGAFRTWRIETNAGSPGFTTPPALRIGFPARDILFLAAGAPPYTLAMGRADDPDAYLPAASLMTQAAGQPVATARSSTSPVHLALADPADAGRSSRQALLWLILLGATALLAALAWLLWKNRPADPRAAA